MITEAEYLAAKSIVDAYEAQEWEEGHMIADAMLSEDDPLQDDEWEHEDDFIEDLADLCSCGAYRMTPNGHVMVAECYCQLS